MKTFINAQADRGHINFSYNYTVMRSGDLQEFGKTFDVSYAVNKYYQESHCYRWSQQPTETNSAQKLSDAESLENLLNWNEYDYPNSRCER